MHLSNEVSKMHYMVLVTQGNSAINRIQENIKFHILTSSSIKLLLHRLKLTDKLSTFKYLEKFNLKCLYILYSNKKPTYKQDVCLLCTRGVCKCYGDVRRHMRVSFLLPCGFQGPNEGC